MELYKAEAESIKKQIDGWLLHSENELECTFGKKGTVDATTFFQVAQRLRSKGLRELSQEDRLTISTPEHIRFTIQSMGVIQQYCRDDKLAGKPFIAMIKDRSSGEANVDLDDYDVRIKTRREVPIANNEASIQTLFAKWPQQKKAFRMIRRWSFEESGLRYDLSIVRSTARDSKGDFKWQRKFLDQDLSMAPYLYEIEVELIRIEGDTYEVAQKRLVKGIGEVLRGIQKNSVLIRNSKKEKVIQTYQNFIKSNKFLGCNPVTMEQRNFSDVIEEETPNIRTGYNVTDKADGLRTMGYCDTKGDFYLIDIGLNVYRTGLNSINNRESIVDGEWVTRTSKNEPINIYLIFDIYYTTDKKLVSKYPFYNEKEKEEDSRFYHIKNWVETFNKGDGPKKSISWLNAQIMLKVAMKTFYQAKSNDMSIFKNASRVLDTHRIYYTDGLIFTPNNLPLPGYDEKSDTVQPGVTFFHQFKWKPSEDNTIDFLVRFEKVPDNPVLDRVTIGIKPETNETVRYKTMRLYVGSARAKAFNPRDILLNERKLGENQSHFKEYRPIPFYPKQFYDSMASVCYGEVKVDNATQEEYVATEHNNEPIQDKSIIEMRYDTSMPRGWRWIPLRIRHDKTERLQKGILARTLNSEMNADSVWSSIHDPISESMIRSGSTQPNTNEINMSMKKVEARDNVTLKYFNRKPPVEDLLFVRGMREFHNHYVKEVLLYNACLKGGSKNLVDIACGTGSDIRRWINAKVSFVLGVDYAGDNITNIDNGAYAQYANHKERNKRAEVPPMVFVIGDSSKRIVDGRAGSTDEERDILRSTFGRYPPMGPIPPYIDHFVAGNLKEGADAMVCMFALHYFFKSKESLNGLLGNIREVLKVGGYFFGCCFDGDSIFKFLKDVPVGGTKTGLEKDAILWNIRKDYDMDELIPNEDSLGQTINVDFISIGNAGGHDEYLVSFPYFVERMKENGLELLNDTQAKEVGLLNGTSMFEQSYELSKHFGKNYVMSDAVKQFSFLNRWFIFVKSKETIAEEETKEEEYVPLVNTRKKKSPLQNIVPKETTVNVVVNKESSPMSIVHDVSTLVPEKVMEREAVKSFTIHEESRATTNEGKKEIVAADRTLPVQVSSDVPSNKMYSANEVFNFYFDAAIDDKKLMIGDGEAARWISPQTPFRIKDFEDPSIIYPSLEHFMGAMMYKYGASNPELAKSIFSRDDGFIHKNFLRKRLVETKAGTVAIPYAKDHELVKDEINAVKDEIKPAAFKKYKVAYNEAAFLVKKDELLRKAVEQRYKDDERMRKILEAARKKGKYLLYFTQGTTAVNLGGMRKSDGIIYGDNKLGKLYMELAGYTE